MALTTGSKGRLSSRLRRLERHGAEAAPCRVCGGESVLVLRDRPELLPLTQDRRCRGCGAPMKVLRGIDVDLV